MEKLGNTKAELKKNVACKKSVYLQKLVKFLPPFLGRVSVRSLQDHGIFLLRFTIKLVSFQPNFNSFLRSCKIFPPV